MTLSNDELDRIMDFMKARVMELASIYDRDDEERFFICQYGKNKGESIALTTQEVLAGIEIARNYATNYGNVTFGELCKTFDVVVIVIPSVTTFMINRDMFNSGLKRMKNTKLKRMIW